MNRVKVPLLVAANTAVLGGFSAYGRHSPFSVLWLAAAAAIGHALATLSTRPPASDNKPARSPSPSCFSLRYFAAFVVAFVSLGVGVKHVDVVPLMTLLHGCTALQSLPALRRARLLLAVALCVALTVLLPFSSMDVAGVSTMGLRLLGASCVIAYTFLLRHVNADELRGRESFAAIGALCFSGYASTWRLNSGSAGTAVDSYFTPLMFVLCGAINAAMTRHRWVPNPGDATYTVVGVCAAIGSLVGAVSCAASGSSRQACASLLRDCCLFGVVVFVSRHASGRGSQKEKSDLALQSVEGGKAHNSFLKFIVRAPRERKLAMYLVLTVVIMFLEFGYGVGANSLGLVSDSFHMLLDAASLGIGLFSAYASSWIVSEKKYPFGYSRYETIGGFVNGTLLLFIAMYIMIESAERILDPPEIEGTYLLTVSIIGLLVNILGILFFHEAHGHSHSHDHGHSHAGAGCSSSSVDHNMRGVYLHILADLLGSVSVIISSLLMRFFGWWIADPVCSAISATLVLLSAFPLLEETGKVLLLTSPESGESLPAKLIAAISQQEHAIANITSVKVWVHSTAPREKLVCTVSAKLNESAHYASARDSLYQRITDTLAEVLGDKSVYIALHLE